MSKSSPRNAHDRALNRISKVVAKYGGGEHPDGPVVSTILMDLRHFCDEKGLNFADLNEVAKRSYAEQTLFD